MPVNGEQLKICNHFHNIKKEKFSNQLANRQNFICDLKQKNKCDSMTERWLCLECAFVGCSRNSDKQCALMHFQSTQHKIIVSLNSQMIWCYTCDDDLESLVDEVEDEQKSSSMIKFIDMVRQSLYKIPKSKIQPIITQQTVVVASQIESDQKYQPLHYIPAKIFGLKNIGNTCFFNSVLQCLNATKCLSEAYLEYRIDFNSKFVSEIISENSNQNNIEDEWCEVDDRKKQKQAKYQDISKKPFQDQRVNAKFQQFLIQSRRSKNIFDPTDLFKSIQVVRFTRYKSMAQQDAQELLRCLLDQLSNGEEKILIHLKRNSRFFNLLISFQSVLKDYDPRLKSLVGENRSEQGKSKVSFVEKFFGFYLCSHLECLECGQISRTFDFCLDLAVQIAKPKNFIHPKSQTQPVIVYPTLQPENVSVEEQKKINEKIQNKGQKKNKSNKDQKNKIVQEENKQLEVNKQVDQIAQEEKKDVEYSINTSCFKYKSDYYKEIPMSELEQDTIPYFDRTIDVLMQKIHSEPELLLKKADQLGIDDCLQAFTQWEQLNIKQNYFKCDRCFKNKIKSSSALKRFQIYEPPKILTIILKRFTVKSNGRFEKITDHVNFPEVLDLATYVMPKGSYQVEQQKLLQNYLSEQKYKLYGVLVHSGTMTGGHYFAYTKIEEQQEDHWFQYSDTNFKEVSLKTVLNAQAYILFYEKIQQK